MARRGLLSGEERRALFGVPDDHDILVRLYTLSRSDLDLALSRGGNSNRLGVAVQLALLWHPGIALAQAGDAPAPLVHFMARQLDLRAASFATYGERPQTVTDHARELMARLGQRPSTETDLPLMIGAAAEVAWSTDDGAAIVTGIMDALRRAGIPLPTSSRLERAGIAGRARARKRIHDALIATICHRSCNSP